MKTPARLLLLIALVGSSAACQGSARDVPERWLSDDGRAHTDSYEDANGAWDEPPPTACSTTLHTGSRRLARCARPAALVRDHDSTVRLAAA